MATKIVKKSITQKEVEHPQKVKYCIPKGDKIQEPLPKKVREESIKSIVAKAKMENESASASTIKAKPIPTAAAKKESSKKVVTPLPKKIKEEPTKTSSIKSKPILAVTEEKKVTKKIEKKETKKADSKNKISAKKSGSKIQTEVVSPSIRYSDVDLQMFKENIETKLTEELEQLEILKIRLDELNSLDFSEISMTYSMHQAEQGSEFMEIDKTYKAIEDKQAYIQKLQDALKRVENKTYGICKHCNILIAKERLLFVPITTQSASFKLNGKCPDDGIDKVIPRPDPRKK